MSEQITCKLSTVSTIILALSHVEKIFYYSISGYPFTTCKNIKFQLKNFYTLIVKCCII